jgi:hypothetical protein
MLPSLSIYVQALLNYTYLDVQNTIENDAMQRVLDTQTMPQL